LFSLLKKFLLMYSNIFKLETGTCRERTGTLSRGRVSTRLHSSY
jgi:hypothetical protein